jgi:hypothetical protein
MITIEELIDCEAETDVARSLFSPCHQRALVRQASPLDSEVCHGSEAGLRFDFMTYWSTNGTWDGTCKSINA